MGGNDRVTTDADVSAGQRHDHHYSESIGDALTTALVQYLWCNKHWCRSGAWDCPSCNFRLSRFGNDFRLSRQTARESGIARIGLACEATPTRNGVKMSAPISATLSIDERQELSARLVSGVIKAGKLAVWSVDDDPRYHSAADMQAELGELHSDLVARVHYHAGRNITGYLPESDDTTYPFESFKAAMTELEDELSAHWDSVYDVLGEDCDYQAYRAARDDMRTATGPDFLAYVPTNPESAHDLPTAYWINPCSEASCF